jgi:hypothetical protein
MARMENNISGWTIDDVVAWLADTGQGTFTDIIKGNVIE